MPTPGPPFVDEIGEGGGVSWAARYSSVIVTAASTRGSGLGWIPDNLNRGHLDYFWLLGVLNAVNFVVYLWSANWYRCKRITTTETEAQAVPRLEGRLQSE
uniref:Uncharacterized protein n=1 Tax=Oryza nivara TaxID=4536 RepID=A0A0E0I6R5_ORYNI